MNDNNICPCCPKGCDLGSPRCPRGEEYARTGAVPARDEKHGNHNCGRNEHRGQHEHVEHHECRGHHEHGKQLGPKGCRHDHKEKPFSHYDELDTNGKLLAQLKKLSHQSHMISGGKGGQKCILHILDKEGSMTQRELTARLDIQPGSASEIIKKLENAGLIVRTANETDRRTADISLTESGKAHITAEVEENNSSNLFSALTEEERSKLLGLLEKLSADWDCRSKKRHQPHHDRNHGAKHEE